VLDIEFLFFTLLPSPLPDTRSKMMLRYFFFAVSQHAFIRIKRTQMISQACLLFRGPIYWTLPIK